MHIEGLHVYSLLMSNRTRHKEKRKKEAKDFVIEHGIVCTRNSCTSRSYSKINAYSQYVVFVIIDLGIDLNEYDTHTMSLAIIIALRYIFFSLALSLFLLYLTVFFFFFLFFYLLTCAQIHCSIFSIVVWEVVAMTKREHTMTKKKNSSNVELNFFFFFFCYIATTTAAVCLPVCHSIISFPFFRPYDP